MYEEDIKLTCREPYCVYDFMSKLHRGYKHSGNKQLGASMKKEIFREKLRELDFNSYSIENTEDGQFTLRVKGVNEYAAGKDEEVLFDEMISFLSGVMLLGKGLSRTTDLLLGFCGDANSVYALASAIAGVANKPEGLHTLSDVRGSNRAVIENGLRNLLLNVTVEEPGHKAVIPHEVGERVCPIIEKAKCVFPVLVETKSGIVYVLFGNTAETCNTYETYSTYDAYALGNEEEDVKYKNGISLVGDDEIIAIHNRALSPQMSRRMTEAMKAYAKYLV